MSRLATWLKKEKETNILRQVSALKTTDPLENWELTTEIGDGAFGTVYKVALHHFLFPVTMVTSPHHNPHPSGPAHLRPVPGCRCEEHPHLGRRGR